MVPHHCEAAGLFYSLRTFPLAINQATDDFSTISISLGKTSPFVQNEDVGPSLV